MGTDEIEAERLDIREAVALAIRLCDDLEALHRRGMFHGGISPRVVRVAASPPQPALLPRTIADASGAARLQPQLAEYMSPEQTGRIARPVDYRTDFYSLGATLYALLVGRPPFASGDPLELVHAHIARTPVSPSEHRAEIPPQLSAIVLKLLAKEPDDRFQSADGLRRDLERCRRELADTGTIRAFPLGEDDLADRLVIPRRLYGRDRQVRQLLGLFDEVCTGPSALLLVAGYSGIGKTSLIAELYRPIVRERGYFITGKADQVIRTTPYGALVQAFRGFVAQLLTESEERLSVWRARLLASLGGNAGVLAAVLPDIELVLGPQPAPPPLEPAESQNRFRYVLQNFLQAVARADHPLVMVLDDLQWADSATLDLLEAIVTNRAIGHLLVVGAYRDNEVGADHPLARAVSRVEAGGGRIVRLPLAPLSPSELVSFLNDVLGGAATETEPLAHLFARKTGGNPFFVIQFLRAMEQRGFFTFDHERRRWQYDLDAIARAGTTDNVVDLMRQKIRWLSPPAEAALTRAACIGSRFSLRTLTGISHQPAEEIAAGLAEATEAGLIERHDAERGPGAARDGSDVTYVFLHDQVQQAAYGLIPDDQRKPVHLDVGRLLLGDQGDSPTGDRLFEVVNHLNVGRELVTDEGERHAFAALNLAAGRRARSSGAHQAATDYFDAGISLLSGAHWARDYELSFALHVDAAECRYLTGAFDRAEAELARLLERAATIRDRAMVHEIRIKLYENQSRWTDSFAAGRAALSPFGIRLPDDPEGAARALDSEVAAAQEALGTRAIASLADLPALTDPDMRQAMRVLTTLWASAYLSGNQTLARLISAILVRLSLEHGHTEDSAYGYVTHAITIGPVRGDYEAAYEWGTLALAVHARFGDIRQRARIHQQFQAHVKLWRQPFETCLPHAREARRSGLESGDFTYAGYGAATEAWSAWLVSRNVDDFLREYGPHLDLLARVNMTAFRDAHLVLLAWARALAGRTAGPTSLDHAEFDERTFVGRYEATSPFFLMFLYTARLHLDLLYGRYDEAVSEARRAREVTAEGIIWPVLIEYWMAIALSSLAGGAADPDRRSHLEAIIATRDRLAVLARHCRENFGSWWLLVSAEVERLKGQAEPALGFFHDAVEAARQAGRLSDEALAHERLAAFLLERGADEAASQALREARQAYAEWGATAKVQQLEAEHGRLLDVRQHAPVPRAEGDRTADARHALDSATVLKVAQAVAREVELDGLLRRLIELSVENAGAERGIFLEESGGTLLVQAEAATNPARVVVRQGVPIERVTTVAQRIVRYVHRTGQDVVLGDAGRDERFAGDPHLQEGRVKSVLCTPVRHQGRPGGVLYLENNLTSDAFTPARLEVMRVLSAQAAISLENARLYERMRGEIERRTVAEQALRVALDEVETLKNRLEVENVYLQEEIRTQHNFDEIVGSSPALVETLARVERVAPTESTVLIVGETGVGKELVARAVHHHSRRAGRPLVKVNCGAIPPGLVESELFGHVKGAFTGALDKRIGRFEVASGGTIFLDEVGELPLDAQVKLLRVLQEQEFEPVGSSRTVRVDIRVIAATNRDLAREVAAGRFRPDLLYRLNVFPIEVPPLRERRSDIPILVAFVAAGLSRKLGKPIQGMSARSLDWMMSYDWPGNIRELQNLVERAAILSTGPVIEVAPALAAAARPVPAPAPAMPATGGTLDDAQRSHILAVLGETGGVIEGARGAATRLGMHPNTLRSRIKKLGIVIPTSRARAPRA